MSKTAITASVIVALIVATYLGFYTVSDKRLLSAATAAHDILNNTQFQREK